MALVEINWKPSPKTLEEFSQAAMFFLGMVACPWSLWRGETTLAVACWLTAVAFRGVGLVRPQWLRGVFLLLSVAGWPIGWVVSHLALAVIYYLVLTPLGWWFRVVGRDPLARRFDRQAESYWEAYNPDQGKSRYLRQF